MKPPPPMIAPHRYKVGDAVPGFGKVHSIMWGGLGGDMYSFENGRQIPREEVERHAPAFTEPVDLTRTLRDEFAGQAAAVLLAAVNADKYNASYADVADDAYKLADAMMLRRQQ